MIKKTTSEVAHIEVKKDSDGKVTAEAVLHTGERGFCSDRFWNGRYRSSESEAVSEAIKDAQSKKQ